MILKKGTQVKVISGKDKGKTGEILEINRSLNKVKIKINKNIDKDKGEILVKTPYLQKCSENKLYKGWFKTGDIGKIHSDMSLSILGRKKDVIIKDGKNGSHFFDSQNNFSIKAFPVNKVVDTTGAGDAFIGGILRGKMNGLNIFESMKIGAVTASFCIQGVGVDGLCEMEELEFKKRLIWMHQNHTSW